VQDAGSFNFNSKNPVDSSGLFLFCSPNTNIFETSTPHTGNSIPRDISSEPDLEGREEPPSVIGESSENEPLP